MDWQGSIPSGKRLPADTLSRHMDVHSGSIHDRLIDLNRPYLIHERDVGGVPLLESSLGATPKDSQLTKISGK